LPDAYLDYGLRTLASGGIGAKQDGVGLLAIRAELESDRRTSMPEPDLRSIDAVPVRALAFLKQKVDGSNGGADTGCRRGPEGFHVPSTLGMRRHTEGLDDILCVGWGTKWHG
jgi:hypothetical protein